MTTATRDATPPSAEQVHAGQAIYTKTVLRFYDLYVLGLSCRFVWRCPMPRILALYDHHVTANHLDVGVATGAFLDRCRWPVERPRIALMDLNPNSLAAAGRRIARFRPEIYRANVLDPIPCPIERFDSISIASVLHCLPGTIRTKGIVFDNLRAVLNPGGVLFGATILNGGARHNWLARQHLAGYNARGIFTNLNDDLDGLREVLAARFSDVVTEVVGSVALFSGRSR